MPVVTSSQPLIIIPARMASTRLPNKPLADIAGLPMIVQVLKRAQEAGVGPVLVACDGEQIAEAVRAGGGQAVLTDADVPSGSDRIWQALERYDATGTHDIIINLQGDLPTFDGALLAPMVEMLVRDAAIDIVTLVAPITREEEKTAPHVVKPVIAFDDTGKAGRALYFSRASVPHGEGVLYHHIGVYAYRREALARFVSLPPSPLEQREKLEQLRALEAGLHMQCIVVDTVPLGVDTPEDLARAREILLGL
jgi:3-deoxy-manno-octulosonate cytidylyltransferase (CMP-KDO synthetase)